jgi:DNA-binding transcriptional MerR regulator
MMALIKTWYDVDAAADKFGLKKSTLLFWVDEGVVRCERDGGDVLLVNIDDVRLQVADKNNEQTKG